MTGFASQTFNIPLRQGSLDLIISIKSVNGRFFEATYKMPYFLNLLEAEIAKRLKHELIRGTVFVSIYSSKMMQFKSQVEPVVPLVKSYLDAIKNIQEQFSITGNITLHDIITLPSIFEISEEPLDRETEQKILAACSTVLQLLVQDRAREGAALQEDLKKRIIILRQQLSSIEPRAAQILETRKEMLYKNLEPLVNENNKEQYFITISQQLDKMDIHEELIRFITHLNNLEVVVNSQDREKGKKIDFIMQELFREINTLAAKCADAEISTHAVNIKVELEKAREQAQNIV